MSFTGWLGRKRRQRAERKAARRARPKKKRLFGYKMTAKVVMAAHMGLMIQYPPARIYQLNLEDIASGKAAADFVEAARNADKVVFPHYSLLPPGYQRVFNESAPVTGCKDGAELYARLPEKYKAGILNLLAKSQATELPDGTTVLDHLHAMREIAQDRIFLDVDGGMAAGLDAGVEAHVFSHRGKVNSGLHHSERNYTKYASYKTYDPKGNLDITLSRDGDKWMAEIDIDYYKGLRHAFLEVAYHHAFNTRTDPYKVEKILRNDQGIDPGYRPK